MTANVTVRTPPRWGWPITAGAIAALVLLPILTVVILAFGDGQGAWAHLSSTVLPRYLWNTFVLMASVGLLTSAIGAGAAWLVVMYRFPGRSWLQWALLLPLAVPAYVGAYALVDFLEYAGPVQTGLRGLMGWQSARDYWFPEIRSRGSAIIVLSAALYPYVYLLARAALKEQSGAIYDVARSLGSGGWARFWRVGLPLTRPAIAAGAAVVMMETVNDFGTVDYFAVQTLTTGIFTLWTQSGNLAGAAQVALVGLALIVALVLVERAGRQRSRFFVSGRQQSVITPRNLSGGKGWAAAAACLFPVAVGFILPVAVLFSHGLSSDAWFSRGFIAALLNTCTVGGAAALITVILGVTLVYGARLAKASPLRWLLPLTALGYAIPGAVLGLGLLIPLARFDNWFADQLLALTGNDPGLLISGSIMGILLAYVARFFAIAIGAAEAAFGRVPPSLPMAARSLGQTATGTLRRVYVPLIRGSVASALLLIFVDCVKELPATLMLRPFGYETLATRVHSKAALENLTDAAPAALMICAVGLVAVSLLARANR